MTGPDDGEGFEERLFAYGTLREPVVQVAVFGRTVEGVEATLFGWRVDSVQVTDDRVIALSGTDIHRTLKPGAGTDRVDGLILKLTPHDLLAADEYEATDYRRMKAPLGNGRFAWVYVAKD